MLSLRRLIADLVDLLVALVLGLVLSNTGVGYFFASRAVVMLRIGAPETIWNGPIPMMMGIFGPLVYSMPFAILVVQLLELPIGFSPSKVMLGLRIVSDESGAASRRQLWRRVWIKATPWWGLTVALLTGSWVLALVFSLVGMAMLANVGLSLFTLTRAVHDAWSGTRLALRRSIARRAE